MGTAASTLLQDVQFRLVRDDVATSHILRRLDWASQDIASKYFVPEMEATISIRDNSTAPTGKITLATTTNRIRWIISATHQSSGNNLIMAGPTLAATFSNSTLSGTPTYWNHFGNWLYYYPRVSAALATVNTRFTVRYRKYPASITAGSTNVELPSYLDEAIVSGACYMILRDLNENENASIAYQQYIENLRSLKPYQAEEFAVSSQLTSPQQG